jgi:hypothetical protein
VVDAQPDLSSLLQDLLDGDAESPLLIHCLAPVDAARVILGPGRGPFAQEPMISKGVFEDACREILSVSGSADQEPENASGRQSEGDQHLAARAG